MTDLEQLRHSFRPQRITSLFVGESPPSGGTFFYKGDSNLYRSLKSCFDDSADFLAEFKARCFFLDDLVLYPINHIEDRKVRHEHRRRAIPSFARRLVDYRPSAVVVLMCAIEEMVVDATHQAELSIPLYVTPFPNQYHRDEFRAKMAEIIPKLPVCNLNVG